MDYYQILGVNKDASVDDIKKAYRYLAMKYHPDRNIGDANAAEVFKKINEAYATLVDVNLRANYNSNYSKFQAPQTTNRPAKKKHHSSSSMHFTDAPPPKFDLWGNPLTEEERQAWDYYNRTDILHQDDVKEKLRRSAWKDSQEGSYMDRNRFDIR